MMGFDDKQGTPVATECGGSFFVKKMVRGYLRLPK
jgi:hypothetical protein